MQTNEGILRGYLRDFDFQNLMVEGLGWDHHHEESSSVLVDGAEYSLKPIAEKRKFVIYECGPDEEGEVPPYPLRRKIENQVSKQAFEHMLIFVDAKRSRQVWQWVRREPGKPVAFREQTFQDGQTGRRLLQRIQDVGFGLDEEDSLGVTDVVSRVRHAMDVERVTKRFYDRFKEELQAFHDFIEGITEQVDRQWYASLMLNRMMFVYFIQKQGFLDGDTDYLRNRLNMVREQSDGRRFQQFYRMFLLRLFHEGLGQPESEREPDLAALLGQVPFLNGGLFDVHELEKDNEKISIPDEAFERVFDFFDGYQWHLDERPTRDDNEINPDVLGYIFEKYINQKQMGAYYTKEDITGYITRNTVIPFLFDAAMKECPVAFIPGGGVWRLLRDDPDRYIYPAVGHGMSYSYSPDTKPDPMEQPLELPANIAAGIGDVSKRDGWNGAAPEEYALPTETWREVVARRQRYAKVRARLESGEIQDINELITLNLDIERFARDVIAQSEGPELLRAFWNAMSKVSVLDPTCGSGAFLFAALNILEPLYTTCLEGMQGFLDDIETSRRPRHPETLGDLHDILDRVDSHPSQRYFTLKSIVLDNLYGVDIMEEAVEICKLRLFLKLVAQLESYDQIEPLPDIDFNIRAGNTLVGFTSLDAVRNAMTITPDGQHRMPSDDDRATLTRIGKEAAAASRAFDRFRQQQTELRGEVSAEYKAELRSSLESLREELNHLLASEYGVQPADASAFEEWRTGHQPFHWFVEFYGIMREGGFDVIVGNPPYVQYSEVRKEYQVRDYITEKCGNLYAFVLERSYSILRDHGKFGMIVQLPYSCTSNMESLQNLTLSQSGSMWLSHYDDRPAKLFDGLDHIRATILISERFTNSPSTPFSTAYNRWHSEARSELFQCLAFVAVSGSAEIPTGTIPKIGIPPGSSLLDRMRAFTSLNNSYKRNGRGLAYYHNSPQYWVRAMNFAPYFWNERDGEQMSRQVKELKFTDDLDTFAAVSALNSSLFYWWFILLSDCRHLNRREIDTFPVGLNEMSHEAKSKLASLCERLMTNFKQNSRRKETRYRTTGRVVYDEFNQKPSKPIVDEIDRVLATHYGFTDEELDYIINYDIKYRMGSG